jgi:Protein of unknown function (DUF3551)
MRTLVTTLFLASALTLSAAAVNAQTTQANSGSFCLTPTKAGGAKNCSFTSMAACEKAKAGEGDNCSRNTASTTGSAVGSGTAPSAIPAQDNSRKPSNN